MSLTRFKCFLFSYVLGILTEVNLRVTYPMVSSSPPFSLCHWLAGEGLRDDDAGKRVNSEHSLPSCAHTHSKSEVKMLLSIHSEARKPLTYFSFSFLTKAPKLPLLGLRGSFSSQEARDTEDPDHRHPGIASLESSASVWVR